MVTASAYLGLDGQDDLGQGHDEALEGDGDCQWLCKVPKRLGTTVLNHTVEEGSGHERWEDQNRPKDWGHGLG